MPSRYLQERRSWPPQALLLSGYQKVLTEAVLEIISVVFVIVIIGKNSSLPFQEVPGLNVRMPVTNRVIQFFNPNRNKDAGEAKRSVSGKGSDRKKP